MLYCLFHAINLCLWLVVVDNAFIYLFFFIAVQIMSGERTPESRKRKLSCSGSWRQIANKIPSNCIPSGINNVLPLLEEMEDFDVFIQSKERSQRAVLESFFGDSSSDLIESVMNLVEVSILFFYDVFYLTFLLAPVD